MYPKNPKSPSPFTAQPPPTANQPHEGQWTTGLFDCFHDSSTCFLTCCCPCVVFGRTAEIIDRGTISCTRSCLISYGLGSVGCAWLHAATYRTKLRRLFSLPEEPYTDSLVHCCCCPCALSQEYTELKNRGVDPSIGWEANVEKWKQEGVKPPIAEPGMAR